VVKKSKFSVSIFSGKEIEISVVKISGKNPNFQFFFSGKEIEIFSGKEIEIPGGKNEAYITKILGDPNNNVPST
jgi:hypothetical protein